MVLESCSVKRLLFLILFIGGITILVFLRITSSNVLTGLNATVITEVVESIKDNKNSSNKCWLQEENTIIKECHSCVNRPECINASFVETIECKFSGLTYRNCNKLTPQEEFFWVFPCSQLLLAAMSLFVIQHKKKKFYKKLMKRIQSQLDSVV